MKFTLPRAFLPKADRPLAESFAIGVFLLIPLLLGTITSVFAAIPPGTTLQYVTVDPKVQWTDTGLDVDQYSTVTVQAVSGGIFVPGFFQFFGISPRGYSLCSADTTYLLPGTTCWSLIGSVNKQNPLALGSHLIFSGSQYSFSPTTSGRFYLAPDSITSFNLSQTAGSWNIKVIRNQQPAPTPSPSPSPTPSPTPVPTPSPFLDLPWEYQEKGLTFNDAALAMTSYLDHSYPLLSASLILSEPSAFLNQITTFENEKSTTKNYSSHDGYDYGTTAKAYLDEPVIAAASGIATFRNDCIPCGNMILIDHGNGYQTRYMHLLDNTTIVTQPGQKISVVAGREIGKLGFTGNVDPKGPGGAHIHFMVIQDKNNDGNFEDNIPDGVTDPFGWQSSDPDPWPLYSFSYAGQQRTGNKSYYLWKKRLDTLDATLPTNGGVFQTGHYTATFPQGITTQNLSLILQSAPLVFLSNQIRSIGPSLEITAQDILGNIITQFQKSFELLIDFSTLDLTRYSTETLSFYSSPDGTNWTQEPTTVDMTTQTASTQVDHLTHFALMAEREDMIPPTTTPEFTGNQGQPYWFRSDTSLTLDAQDNPGGLGVAYTLYRITKQPVATISAEWKQFKTPLSFNQEGIYTIEFFSVDNDDNQEAIKSTSFHLDLTPPQVSISVTPMTLWPPNGKLVPVTVTSSASDTNLFSTLITVEDEYHQFEPAITSFAQTINLEARREGYDLDGRQYILKIVAEDQAGNQTQATTQVVVPHDQGKGK